MNLGSELAQIKNCKTQEEVMDFIKQHNLDPRSVSYFWDKEGRAITFDAVSTNGRSRVDITVTVE
jgi:arsenate reductase-like glutaredoxin family protein